MGGGIGTEKIGDVDSEGRKIGTTSEKTGDRHNDVIDERFNDGGKRTTNGNTDSKINYVAAIDKLFEFADKGTFSDVFDGVNSPAV